MRALGRDGAEVLNRPVGHPDRRSEPDLARDRIHHEDPVVLTGLGELVHRRPDVHPVRVHHLQAGRLLPRHHRSALQLEALARCPVRDADLLVVHGLGVHDPGGGAHGEGGHVGDLRWCRVAPLSRLDGDQSAPHPSGVDAPDRGFGVGLRKVHHHVTGLVEPAGLVTIDVARRPDRAVPCLPGQRRVAGIDPDPGHPTVQPEHHSAGRHGVREPDHQGVTDHR